jgi:hypothetical protein
MLDMEFDASLLHVALLSKNEKMALLLLQYGEKSRLRNAHALTSHKHAARLA